MFCNWLMNRRQAKDLLKWLVESGVSTAVGNPTINWEGLMPKKISTEKNIALFNAPITQHKAASINSLKELRESISNFDQCDLRKTATNLVFGEGTLDPLYMVIGEAPGADEDAQGRPFVGLSGQLLDKMLQSISLRRDTNTYITNIVPWRPPFNRQPSTQEIELYLPYLERHIELIRPKLLLLVGGVSAKSILRSKEGIMKLRTGWHTYVTPFEKIEIPALATYHPAFLLRSPGQKAQVWRDLLIFQSRMEK